MHRLVASHTQPGMEPATWRCALTRARTRNRLVHRTMLRPTEPPGRGPAVVNSDPVWSTSAREVGGEASALRDVGALHISIPESPYFDEKSRNSHSQPDTAEAPACPRGVQHVTAKQTLTARGRHYPSVLLEKTQPPKASVRHWQGPHDLSSLRGEGGGSSGGTLGNACQLEETQVNVELPKLSDRTCWSNSVIFVPDYTLGAHTHAHTRTQSIHMRPHAHTHIYLYMQVRIYVSVPKPDCRPTTYDLHTSQSWASTDLPQVI